MTRSLVCAQIVLRPNPILRQSPSPQCGFPVVFEVFTEQGAYLGGACTNPKHSERIQATTSEPTAVRPARGL